ncbi:peptidoglycan/xylan/chitin deacetylase (PgdA/CDA1 family) [Silvimonas terrae]|uniref:Peptidoglycan/xylan/chitin deacetylase (PgdA/CDA1 family) n=1 Tax=Silvimonas terrae TaxID=300266 RepID=A0A840R8C7_9NEIS|nr:polysaccharide deacetylase family protein [Silvimonas terrae]MBB5189565.1 peptidoglycan/xylan/chitin deacetylase (PgdA/CDA1 family) [Silvimonas terrae]
MRLLALKIDVDTFRGTRVGVPRLVEALQRHKANATFLWSLGPDHTGRAIKRVFRPGFMKKVSRTSVVEHYGIKTLMYGTLLPGPDIGKRCAELMRSVAAAGFENGIHTWDHIRWQDGVAGADEAWTRAELNKAAERFNSIFGEPATTHGAAGWQMNEHAYRYEQHMGLRYAADTRGTHPFWPVVKGELVRCVQLPGTLPTLDELLGVDGLNADNVHEHILRMTEDTQPYGHVFTLHAELEGMKLLPTFERLLAGWIEQGYQLVSCGDLYGTLDPTKLPYHHVEMTEIPGRSGVLAMQGAVFP